MENLLPRSQVPREERLPDLMESSSPHWRWVIYEKYRAFDHARPT
jgi:hypothetical protein